MSDIIINDRYRVVKRIGSGAFGVVYKAVDIISDEYVAIKIENENSQRHIMECKIYNKLKNKTGFPQIKYEGKYDGKNIIIMEYLGPSLDDLFGFTGNRFGLKTVLMIGLQMLNRIETLHECGIIHRDLKPDNFLIGTDSNKSRIHLIDFGLSKDYVINNGEHIPMKTGRTFTGSFRYSSLRNHKGIEQSRRDDLESIGYMLIYFLKGELPWQGVKGSTKSKRAGLIYDKKKNCKISELCKDIPIEFAKFIKYVRDLKFEEKPDYNYLRTMFIELFKNSGYEYDYMYDWNIMAKLKKENGRGVE